MVLDRVARSTTARALLRRSPVAKWQGVTQLAWMYLPNVYDTKTETMVMDQVGGYDYGNSTPLQIARRQLLQDLSATEREADAQYAATSFVRQRDPGWVRESTGEVLPKATVDSLAKWLDEHMEWCFRTNYLFREERLDHNRHFSEYSARWIETYDISLEYTRNVEKADSVFLTKPKLERTKPGHFTVYINHNRVEVPIGQTNIVEICALHGINIPVYCYHPRLPIAGNCRMCLVQLATAPNPVVACAMPASPYLSIFTDTRLVREAREGNVELMLLNHPLDCPICDQAGECELQDISLVFGGGGGDYGIRSEAAGLDSRMYEAKSAFEDKFLNPFIITSFNRCIQCTRCTRFLQEVAMDCVLGMFGRGGACEISTYHNFWEIETELSACITDLCPVGGVSSRKRSEVMSVAV